MDTDTYESSPPLDASPVPIEKQPSEEPAVFEDSRSETSTIDTVSDERIDLTNLTFFTRLYEIPMVNDTVSSIYRIAESNRYTNAIINYAEKVGGFAEKSRPLFKPVEKQLIAIDGLATRSLDLIEEKYPVVSKPTNEVLEAVQSQAKAVETKYPVIARTFAVAKNTANSTLDRVDYLVDYILPQSNAVTAGEGDDASGTSRPDDSTKDTPRSDSPLEKVTILVHKVPQRLNEYYLNQLESSKSAIGSLSQSVKDTVTVYKSEITERSQRLIDSMQGKVMATVNSIPTYLPQSTLPYYEQGKDIITTKAAKLQAEYQRTDEDTRSKVLNLILISGEQVPILEGITSRIFGKAAAADAAENAAPSSDEKDGKVTTN